MESELRYLYRKLAWLVTNPIHICCDVRFKLPSLGSQVREINLNPIHTAFSRSRKLTQLTLRFHPKILSDWRSKQQEYWRQQQEGEGVGGAQPCTVIPLLPS